MEEVPFEREKFGNLTRLWEKRTAKVSVPELNEVMELEEGQVAVFEVVQADLAIQLWAREESRASLIEIGEIIVDYISGNGGKDDIIDILKNEKLSVDVEFQLKLCERCIVKPEKILRNELVWLSQHFPSVINRLATKIMELSNAGAVKKSLKS